MNVHVMTKWVELNLLLPHFSDANYTLTTSDFQQIESNEMHEDDEQNKRE